MMGYDDEIPVILLIFFVIYAIIYYKICITLYGRGVYE